MVRHNAWMDGSLDRSALRCVAFNRSVSDGSYGAEKFFFSRGAVGYGDFTGKESGMYTIQI